MIVIFYDILLVLYIGHIVIIIKSEKIGLNLVIKRVILYIRQCRLP